MKNKPNIKNDRNALVRKWIRENGAATFDFKNKGIELNDGLLFSIENQTRELPALSIKCDGEKFDWKNKDIVLTDGALFSIEKEITKLNKVKDVKSTSIRGIYHIELSKKKYVTECYKCRIWFRELCSTIAYFQSMENLLYDLGYDTGRENDKNKRDKSN
jgi:hypothetical protein